jgi:predicted membrane protein
VVLGLLIDKHRHGPGALTEDITAVALLGDVEIDLSEARVISKEVTIRAYAILKDVEVIIPEGVAVEMSGVAVHGDIENWVRHVSPHAAGLW